MIGMGKWWEWMEGNIDEKMCGVNFVCVDDEDGDVVKR